MEKTAIDQVVIEIKMKGVLKATLDPQILVVFLIETIVHEQVWRVATDRIRGALRFLDGGKIALEGHKMTLTKLNDAPRRCARTHL